MIAIDFADLAEGVYGSVRGAGGALVIGDQQHELEGLKVSESALSGPAGLALEFERLLGPARFEDGAEEWLCALRGQAGGRRIDCLGSLVCGEAAGRGVAAWLDPTLGFSCRADARYPERGKLEAWVLRGAGATAVEDPRLSTASDGAGVNNRAGLELWEAEDSEVPLRLAGELVAAIELEHARCSFLLWHHAGAVGAGRYELAR